MIHQTHYMTLTFGEALNGVYKSISYVTKDQEGNLERRTKLVKIPKGVYSGLCLEVDEDLKISLNVQETVKGLFKRYGDDIYTTLYIPNDFKGQIPYFSLEGVEKLELLAEDLEPESLFQFKKKGFPIYGGKNGKRGDLYVRVFRVFS